MTLGTIESLWRFPVKSFRGEKLDQIEFENQGILGDRAYALIDKETQKIVSAKNARLFPLLLKCSAAYIHPPQIGAETPPVQISLADGTTLASNSENVDQVLSAFFGRPVTLTHVAPDDYSIDQYHPDIENLDPENHRNTVIEQKLGSALFRQMGIASPLAPGSLVDLFPVSVISTSTLDHLHQLQPETNFDIQRFRMNILVKTDASGFVENSWVGKTIAIGDSVRIMITMPDPRCVMTTLAQNEIPKDINVLKTLVQHNGLNIMGTGNYPCAGVYAVILAGGPVNLDDKVILA